VSGGTLAAASTALLEAGAADVRALATHALFSPEAARTLAGSGLEEIAVTDTVALEDVVPPRLAIVSVADLLATTINAVFENTSVSAIFAGENELF
jgi:ribose-phosphate pyrophosphokinase